MLTRTLITAGVRVGSSKAYRSTKTENVITYDERLAYSSVTACYTSSTRSWRQVT